MASEFIRGIDGSRSNFSQTYIQAILDQWFPFNNSRNISNVIRGGFGLHKVAGETEGAEALPSSHNTCIEGGNVLYCKRQATVNFRSHHVNYLALHEVLIGSLSLLPGQYREIGVKFSVDNSNILMIC